MKTIYKYQITSPTDSFVIPTNYKVRHVDMQNGYVTLWIEINTDNPIKSVKFVVYGTGHTINDNDIYVGTCLTKEFVWHVYEQRS